MKILADTHLLLWMTIDPALLSRNAMQILAAADNEIWFSAISILEMAIKQRLNKLDLRVPVEDYRREMIERGFRELVVTGLHAAYVAALPFIHKDPFDRLLVAQATVEDITLITADEQIARYPGPILKI